MASKNEILDILQKWECLFGDKEERDRWLFKTWRDKDRDIDEFRKELKKVVIYILNEPEDKVLIRDNGRQVIIRLRDGRMVEL